MPFQWIRIPVCAGLIIASAWSSMCQAQTGRTHATALERYGLGGHIQAIGVHHGFHIETVALDSAAAEDQLQPHDVIVKVDGEVIRNLDHLRAVMAEAYVDDGEVTLTYTRGTSVTHRVLKCHLKQPVQPVARRRRAADLEDDRPR